MDQAAEYIWNDLQNYAKEIYTAPTYDVWMRASSLDRIEDGQIFIKLPNELTKQKWSEDLQGKIIELAYQYTGKDLIPVFECPTAYDSEVTRNNEKKETLEPIMQEKEKIVNQNRNKVDNVPTENLKKSNLNPDFTFENFIEADSNRFAYTAASVAAENSEIYNPLLIYGGTGLGKTHLMQAVGHDLLRIKPESSVLYVSCLDFVNDYINSIANKSMDTFKKKYTNVDLLLLDDIQFLERKTETQNEFFHIFETIYNNGGQIIITSDQPIDKIPTLQDRIVSRFKKGISCDVEPPNYETRIAILREKAKNSGLDITEEGLKFIATNVKSNVRELEGALKTIQVFAISRKQTNITTVLIQEALFRDQELNKKDEVSISDIQNIVCDFYHIKLKDMKGKSRRKEFVEPRQIAIFLARELTDTSLPTLGKEFGGRDHTTIMHSIEKIENLLKTNLQIKSTIEDLRNKIKYQ